MKDLNTMMDEFADKYGYKLLPMDVKNLTNVQRIVGGELVEFGAEISPTGINHHQVAKEILDVVYAASQQARAMGIDVNVGLEELHRSNLSKCVTGAQSEEELEFAKARYPHAVIECVSEDTYVLKCASTNKVIKPRTYSPADMTRSLGTLLPDSQ